MAKLTQKTPFEEAMRRLEQIAEQMESGEISLEEAVDRYEEASALVAHCRSKLEHAEQRIRVVQQNADGTVRTEPMAGTGDDATDESQ
ncbi:MAG: exodeoxyribonuclease VII small subunit [Phycisphaerales bacterium]|nr:exodeoxyribonuclease VII small subunit [Phycisphaerales bacterium]